MSAVAAVKKITKASFKSFVKKNRDELWVKLISDFDPMQDGVRNVADNGFYPAKESFNPHDNNLGIAGVWLVGGSRNSFSRFDKDGFTGIDVYNCCGHFVVAVKK